MVDMSAAFDVVDTELLLEKMKLYGFDRDAVQWMCSYLTYRSQGVYIEGSMSNLLPLEAGVPQGSILGPIFYTLFTNELPEVVHEESCPRRADGQSVFSILCSECGGMCCYADDSTYTVTGKTAEELTEKLSRKYNVVADFLTDNKLKVNDDKTHLLVMTTRQKRRFIDTSRTRIHTPSANITPSSSERLLGAEVHQDMKWASHILTGHDSLVKSLIRRTSALKKIQNIASFQTRKMIGTGIFMSKLIYLMPLWGGCEDYLVKALQVVQNKAARSITRLSIYTPTKMLLKTCQWISVRQLLVYHSLVMLQKTLKIKLPAYLDSRITLGGPFPYRTRHAANCTIRQIPGNKKDLYRQGWCWRSIEVYNTLPDHIRLEEKLPSFKTKLRSWVEENVAI